MKRQRIVSATLVVIATAIIAIAWARQRDREPAERIQLEPPIGKRER